MSTLKEKLAEARRPRRIVSVCLRGDLTAEAQRIEDELRNIQQSTSPLRLGDGAGDEALAQQLEDLRTQMQAESVTFELEAFSVLRWRELKSKHPVPSEPTPTDTVLGADAVGFFNESVRAAIVEPAVDDDDWEHLTTVLTQGEWDKFVEAVYALNEEPVSIPFSLTAWNILQTQQDASESPDGSGEPLAS